MKYLMVLFRLLLFRVTQEVQELRLKTLEILKPWGIPTNMVPLAP